MCGIAGFHIKDEYRDKVTPAMLERLVDGLLLGIESRGKDATGFVAVSADGKKIKMQKKNTTAENFIQTRHKLPKNVKTVLLHTRAATKGTPEDNPNNHPVVYKSCFATHNGVIRNDDKLFEDMEIERPAEVDSCIVPVMGMQGDSLQQLPERLRLLEGSYALAVIDPKRNPGELLLVRGSSSPLYTIDATWMWMWASSAYAMKDAWGKVWSQKSVPEYNDFSQVEEGVYIHFASDKATAVRYIEKEDVWKRPFVRQNRQVGFQGTATSRYGDCFECNKPAKKLVPDSYFDKDENGVKKYLVSWEIPLCDDCAKMPPKDLSYRYADRELKMKFTQLEDVCRTCEWFPKVSWSENNECQECYLITIEKARKERERQRNHPLQDIPSGVTSARCMKCLKMMGRKDLIRRNDQYLCRAICHAPTNQSEMRDNAMMLCTRCSEAKFIGLLHEVENQKVCSNCITKEELTAETLEQEDVIASFRGNDPNADKYLELHPGDEIPNEMRSAFGNCHNCNHNNVRFIGAGGFAICTVCRGKEVTTDLEDLRERAQLAMAADEQDQKLYSPCDTCPGETYHLTDELNDSAYGLLCDTCYEQIGDGRDEEGEGVEAPTSTTVNQQISIAKHEMQIKMRACVETGWELNVPGAFVMWAIDDCDLSRMKDEELKDMVEDMIARYMDNKWIIQTLISAGRDDLVPERGRLSDEAIAMALGFRKNEETNA